MSILLFLLPVVATDARPQTAPQCDRSDGSNPHRYDPLACWLWNMVIAIPDQSFREGFVTVSIQDMDCTNFTMASMDSSYTPSSNGTTENNPAIQVAVSGISATCIGRYHVTGGIGGSVQAWVQQSGAQHHSLSLSLEFESTSYNHHVRMATAVNATKCQANLEVNTLHFEGSISARLINLFKSSIQHYVTDALSTSTCPAIQPELSKDLTKVIQQADDFIIPLLPKNQSTVGVSAGLDLQRKGKVQPTRNKAQERLTRNDTNSWSTGIDWKVDTPIVYRALEWMNIILDRYLHKGVFVDTMHHLGWDVASSMDCGYFFRGINGLFHSLTNGQVAIEVPKQVENITFVIPGYGRVLLSVQQIQLSGIDKFTNIDILQPLANGAFYSALSTDSDFNITVAMDMEVTSVEGGMVQGDPLKESFFVSVNSSHASIGTSVALDYDKALFQNIHMQDIIMGIQNYANVSQLSCILSPVHSLDVADLTVDVDLSTIVFIPTGSTGTLEKDMDATLNSLLELFITEYDPLVSESLTGLVNGPAQAALNDFINGWIEQQSSSQQNCRSIPTGDVPEFVDFNDFGILHQLNDFLNRSLGTMNQYLTCLTDVFRKSVRPVSFQVENIHVNVTDIFVENPGCIRKLGEYYHSRKLTSKYLFFGVFLIESFSQLSRSSSAVAGRFSAEECSQFWPMQQWYRRSWTVCCSECFVSIV